jgi:hypothetical protein
MEQKIILGVVGVLVVAAIGIFMIAPAPTGQQSTVPAGMYTEFAQCLKDSGTTFFGAFWCPHCNNQKKLFGDAVGTLPYVECSTADGKGQLAVCKDAGVNSYPTWEFPDKTRQTGEVPLAVLAEKTGCVLPAGPAVEVGLDIEGDATIVEVPLE